MSASTPASAVTVVGAADFASTMYASPGAESAPPASLPPGDPAFGVRYAMHDVLGRGGMGIVRACADKRIGRDVAIKTVSGAHAEDGETVARFLREAGVQAQLEHPAIVPVYDIGRDAEGRLYFTMKRVRGETFESIIAKLRKGEQPYSRRKLLTAFASVCQAVHFAHTRGVVHRDLKPGNVMMGDFGEVYVLDWGLAKLSDAVDPVPRQAAADSAPYAAAKTVAGVVMGTPGYMAPEQARGDALDARADVYALGAILFELLAHEPLHASTSASDAMQATLRPVDARPSARNPGIEIAPELDVICQRATALSPDDRYATARELLEAVERVLDGDPDLELRRQLSKSHAVTAHEYAERAFAGGAGSEQARSAALREVGRALAFDAKNQNATRTLFRLFTEPPRDTPPEVAAQIAVTRRRQVAKGARLAGFLYLTRLAFAPLDLWMGIRNYAAWLAMLGAWLLAAVTCFLAARHPHREGKVSLPVLGTGALAIASLYPAFGAYIMLPTLASLFAVLCIVVPPNGDRHRLAIAISMAAVAVPAALGLTGILPGTYSFSHDSIVVRSWMMRYPPLPTEMTLCLLCVVIPLAAGLLVAPIRRALSTAEERSAVQAWQLKQLLPREAQAGTVPPAG